MSENQKQQRPGATPIKNPLLSASVTGLTFDDFPNKPLLLPAAPAIVSVPTPAPVVTHTNFTTREHKSLVTVGSSSLDTENLDEINLNATNEENQTTDISDTNANSLLNPLSQGYTNDSILSQAATSFSALPSVASNVFSTFSKRITSISSRETTPSDQYKQDSNANNITAPQIDIQPAYIQQQYTNPKVLPQGGNYLGSPIEGSIQENTQDNISASEPPKFYTPSDVPSIPKVSTVPPPQSVGGQNSFRFSSKKKLYAPIPGLSDQTQKPIVLLEPTAVSSSVSYDNSYVDSGYSSTNLYQQSPTSSPYSTLDVQKSEDRKVASGLLSKISNLAPTGVLQNITGLVQSAAGSLTQTNKPESVQEYNLLQTSQAVNNYFENPSPNITNTSNTATNFFVPQQQADVLEENKNQTNTLPPTSVFFQTTETAAASQPDITFFNPLNFSNQSSISNVVEPSLDNKPTLKSSSQSSSTYLQPISNTVSKVELFGPSNYLPPHHSATNNQVVSSVPFLPSLGGDNIVPPKSAGPTSYRLQKGTKLYKNPLSPQETAPVLVTANQIQGLNQVGQPPNSTLYPAPSQPVPLFSSPIFTGEYKAKEQEQSVPLISPLATEEFKHNIQGENISSISSPTTVEQKIDNQSHSALLFVPPTIEDIKTLNHENKQPVFPPLYTGEQKHNNQPQTENLFISTSLENIKPNDQKQSIPLLDPLKIEQYSNNQLSPISNTREEISKEHQSNQSVTVLAPLTSEEQTSVDDKKVITVEEQKSNEAASLSALIAPINELERNAKPLAASIDEEQLNDLQTNELKHDISSKNSIIETTNKDSAQYNFSNTQLIVETITPIVDKLEDCAKKILHELSSPSEIEEEETKRLTLPPPVNLQDYTSGNPYRRGSATQTSKPAVAQPALANFFTPEPSGCSSDVHFFATLPAQEPQLHNLNSEANFFLESIENKPSNTSPVETVNFFAKSNNKSSADINPIQPNTALHPPLAAFFPNLPNNFGIAPAIVEDKDNNQVIESIPESNIPPPIGFENFIQPIEKAAENTTVQQETKNQIQQPEVVNRFSKYFNQTQNQLEIVKDPSTFFDSFAGQTSQQQQTQLQQQELEQTVPSSIVTNEEQRIQYFFNNPPPKDANAVGDLNYDLVHSGLGIKNTQQRSLTPISNLVEPPSSACSEFSEISNYTAAVQKSFAANQSIIESCEKSPEKQTIKNDNNSDILKQEDSSAAVITNENHPKELGVDLFKHYAELPEEVLKELRMASILSGEKSTTNPAASVSYKSAVKHWFFKRTIGDKQIWVPFSHYDSALLETSLLMDIDDKPNIVAVEGGRYDANINERKKISVYWESEPIEIRRCSWFYKGVDSKYVPYEEETADLLENEYRQAVESGVWPKTIILGMGEQVVFHGPTVIVHYQQQQNADAWGGTTQTTTRPRVIKRDLDGFNIQQGESQKVDHLLFMVHGIGAACDLKFRSVEEVVDDFRTIAHQLVQGHYKNSSDLGLVGRVEVLPISWHSHLHSVEMGIDEKLRMITLESIPKLRNFTNNTLLDILFYTSPTFCQKIMNTIVTSLNSLYLKYRERHPDFNGGVSLAGHSLGSLILFDLLCNQNPIKESEEKNLENPEQFVTTGSSNISSQMDSNQLEDKQMSYTMGPAGTGQPFITYGQLVFQPKKFFALGSPIGMFVTIRGIDKLGLDFRLPTCPGFYNIFHPYDPVAYRIEALVNPDLSGIRPVLIPHHKGRKRMHLELKETMTRVSMDLKNRFLDKFKTTLESVNFFGSAAKSTKEAEELMEKEVDKVIQMQMELEQQNQSCHPTEKLYPDIGSQNGTTATTRQRTDSVSTCISDDVVEIDFPLGKLNDSKRIDYVLQEAPLEFINEYIFALSSHVCYWDSEDTILFVMKEIYSGLGISPDSQVPQQTMTIERPSSRNSLLSSF